MVLRLHTGQHITRQWGHSAHHSHDIGRDRRQVNGQVHHNYHLWWPEWRFVVVVVLGKQWWTLIRCTGDTESHWLHFSTTSRDKHTENFLWSNPSFQLLNSSLKTRITEKYCASVDSAVILKETTLTLTTGKLNLKQYKLHPSLILNDASQTTSAWDSVNDWSCEDILVK